ncbi:G-type lectin S-receptor serine/threonine-protein kinase [Salix suchowensis]|nr:G-type lectin S-receptor serine/threonine-protein kinase [Salix suchowensis]
MGRFFVILVCCFLLFTFTNSSTPAIINPSQSIRDGETLLSDGGSFELGFFHPANSTNRYLGLWFTKSPQTVLWVANRETPFSDRFGVLNITREGILILYSRSSSIVWSSNSSRTAENPVAELLESGNLVVREANDKNPANFLWQSFDYPCDTMLPGMKLGINFVTRHESSLSSWKSSEDPARGEFSSLLDPNGYPQLVFKKGNKTLARAGSWNGIRFTAQPMSKSDSISRSEFVLNEKEGYFVFGITSLGFPRLTLTPEGIPQCSIWNDRTHQWQYVESSQIDICENYSICGANAYCQVNNSPICSCLDGFTPRSPRDWKLSNWSGGCVRRTPCSDKDRFENYSRMKLPDTSSSWYNKSTGLEECKGICLKNCSCTAYANLDIRGGGSGCLIWFGGLIDTKRWSTGDGQDLYVRIAVSELENVENKRPVDKKKQAVIIASSVILVLGLLIVGVISYTRRTYHRKNYNSEERTQDMDLPMYDLSTIAHATNKFSSRNKLGEGGFGPVYKGTLVDGQEIAVKRLSKSSGQGMDEFKNEVMLIAKLQHRNLVKLLGFCIHKDEKMLIYEYMPNKSLDSIIFDLTRNKLLDWSRRINIIGGIARGLVYLHHDSRLRIIHRDIKASNILLDNELNPKISDFGLARMFGGDQAEANTNRVVGTYGYMSPEYALDGHFSVKSDVFSFGVLVLEIVSGKKNRGFCHPDQNLNLLGHAWILWTKGTPLDLIDECLSGSHVSVDVLRCIHVALLCVQQRPEDRPTMSSVVVMLGSENPLPQPKQPGFFMGNNPPEQGSSSGKHESYSANEVTLTSLEAR